MRKRTLISAIACLALLLVLMPGSALASNNPLTISSNPTTIPGANGCAFDATAPGQNVNIGDLTSCLLTSNTTVYDPPGDGGEIEVESAIEANPCPGNVLTLDEGGAGGTVAFNAATNLHSCEVFIEAQGAVTQTADVTANALEFDTLGSVTLDTPGTNAVGTVEGSVDGAFSIGTASTINVGTLTDPGGALTIYPGASVVIDGTLSVSGQVTVNAPGTGNSVTEQGGGNIVAPTLYVSAGSNVLLDGSGNQFGLAPNYIAASSSSGKISLNDDVSDLELFGINAATGQSFDVTNTGSIVSESFLQAPSGSGSVTSQNGSVTENSGAQSREGQLTVSGTSLSLLADNYAGTLNATATSGDVDVNLFESAGATLGNISASSGAVSVANNDNGPLTASGTVTANSIALGANGFTSASGAELAAPTIAINDADSSDDWSLNASTITPGSGPAMAYSGATSLSIDGGALFNVIPSATTAMTLGGGGTTPAAVLDYNAEGGLVSGTETPPSGTIDNSEYKPVTYSGMAAVNVTGAATPPPTDTPPTSTPPTNTAPTTPPTTTTTTPSAPTCTLRAPSSKVTLPRRVHGKLKGKATVTLVANCAAAVNATLAGRVTVVSKPSHGKAKSQGYGVALVHVALAANTAKKVVLTVPTAVMKALAKKGEKLSAVFTLADPAAGNDPLKKTTVARLT